MRFISILFISLFVGCSGKKELNERDLLAFVNDKENGLTQTQLSEGYTISMTIKPSDFIAQQQLRNGSVEEYDSLRAFYSEFIYLLLDISKDGKDLETGFVLQQQDFASQINFLSSGFSERIKLLQNGKETELADYIYVRSYGSNTSRFLLAFEKVKGDINIIVNGSELGFGHLNFPFYSDHINSIPKLKL